MRYKTKNIVSYIVIFLVFIIVIGVICVLLSDVGNTPISSSAIRVKVNGEYLGTGSEILLKIDELMEFSVEYKFGSKLEDYTVSVVPNVPDDNDVDVIVGRDVYRFSDVRNLIEGFDFEIEEGKFTITNTLDIDGILSRVFGKTAYLSRNVDFSSIAYLRLDINSGNNSVSYMLKLGGFPETIDLDKEMIQF